MPLLLPMGDMVRPIPTFSAAQAVRSIIAEIEVETAPVEVEATVVVEEVLAEVSAADVEVETAPAEVSAVVIEVEATVVVEEIVVEASAAEIEVET